MLSGAASVISATEAGGLMACALRERATAMGTLASAAAARVVGALSCCCAADGLSKGVLEGRCAEGTHGLLDEDGAHDAERADSCCLSIIEFNI